MKSCLTFVVICLSSLYSLPSIQKGEGIFSLSQEGNVLSVQTGKKAVLDWDQFSIGAKEQVVFAQPDSSSIVLNRVFGESRSEILGDLLANGKVYLINPHGVFIGSEALIQASDFLVSTLDLEDEAFLLDQDLLFSKAGDAPIIHHGKIEALEGNIVLLSRALEITGEMISRKGQVVLGAASEILLQPEHIPMLSIRPSQEKKGTIDLKGKIEGLRLELQAEGKAFEKAINLDGTMKSFSLKEKGGRIFVSGEGIGIGKEAHIEGGEILVQSSGAIYQEGKISSPQGSIKIKAEEGLLFQLGTLDVSGGRGGKIEICSSKYINTGNLLAEGFSSCGGEILIQTKGPYIETAFAKISTSSATEGGVISMRAGTTFFSSGKMEATGNVGGSFSCLAPEIRLVSSQIDVSGKTQGGKIFIGKDREGNVASQVELRGNTSLYANALHTGNGGSVFVFGKEGVKATGKIEARGGFQGVGGEVEVSADENLLCKANISVSAKGGTSGTVLLDPKNITIDSATGYFPYYELIDPNSGGGTGFGDDLLSLSTGNIVVSKPNDNAGGTAAGAVYVYDGRTAELISTLIGSSANDNVGDALVDLTNGDFLVVSENWNNGGISDAGAVTRGNGTSGISGIVTTANSLYGTNSSDRIGSDGVTILTNGNYVISSRFWNNGGAGSAGAVTWCNGATGLTGAVSSANSLVGSSLNDRVGVVTALTNGNYVVSAPAWTNGGTASVGAVTWCNGSTGRTGAVSAANSLTGSTASDNIGSNVIALTNGNYVVGSSAWDNGGTQNVGAATWCNGSTGRTGAVSAANSLVGSTASDGVGSNLLALTNGNYVVGSRLWNNGGIIDAGAATWCNGTTGRVGAVSAVNSLVGSSNSDNIGQNLVALTNGNYVTYSTNWNNGGTLAVGAVTWCNGSTGRTGAVSAANSLVGSVALDRVGTSVTALTNGNYVVGSTFWSNGGVAVGAVTWCDGASGRVGAVSVANSLVGAASNDFSSLSVTALSNGNYVASMNLWNGGSTDLGAATWGNGTTGITGSVSSSNSLIGVAASDRVGSGGVVALSDGNYVVNSPLADVGFISAGAVTWGDGSTGITGQVSTSNSLYGPNVNANLGSTATVALSNGNYIVSRSTATILGYAGGGTVGPATQAVSIPVFASNKGETVDNTFVLWNFSGGAEGVAVGLIDPSQIEFDQALAGDMSIAPDLIGSLLDDGTSVLLQANNDITISSTITTTTPGATLTLSAGKSITISGDISASGIPITMTANDLLSSGVQDSEREIGNAVFSIADGVTIDTGNANLTLSLLNGEGKTNSESGDFEIGANVQLSCSGSGALTITASDHNIIIGSGSTLITENGDLFLSAGESIEAAATFQATGTGRLILLSDNLFPTPPAFGTGHVSISGSTLSTGGGELLIYTVERSLNSLPTTINAAAFVPGPVFVDSETEKWGVYYLSSSGIPFTVFYKTGVPDTAGGGGVVVSGSYQFATALSGVFSDWQNPWFKDYYFADDIYSPYLTPKDLQMVLPSLVEVQEPILEKAF